MRTTISMDDDLLAELKERAARSHRSLSQTIEDAVRAYLLRGEPDRSETYSVRRFDSGGYQPGVDLDDNAALLELMEGRG